MWIKLQSCRQHLGMLMFVISCGVVGQSALAITLTFDELNPADYEGEGVETPFLTNEYESLGLVFDGAAYLHTWTNSQPAMSLPNYVIGPGFILNFLGDLPTYVSLFVGSSTGHAVFLDAHGPSGYHESQRTDGELNGWGSEESTPYVPNQFVFFSSPMGISSIELSGQSDAFIDNLTFTNEPSIAAPESSTFILFAIGLLGLMLCNRKSLK